MAELILLRSLWLLLLLRVQCLVVHLVTVFVYEVLIELFRSIQAHAVCTLHTSAALHHFLTDAKLSDLCLLNWVTDLFADKRGLHMRLWIWWSVPAHSYVWKRWQTSLWGPNHSSCVQCCPPIAFSHLSSHLIYTLISLLQAILL